jgi:ribosomal protein S1
MPVIDIVARWQVDVRIINYDKLKKRLSLSMKAYTVPEPRDETEDIRGYKDPEVEGAKTAFQLAWERAQKKSLAKA